ncbi:GNAT family N-acetyltransferase [Stappia sp.]|uniref:GNAT family N-acetyltransferase n=1 Tax=Stappia sp. TaxID=1870903 RepID=UPI003A9A179A
MPIDPARIGFRAVTLADLPLLAGWMETPHWRRWWGDPATELGYIRDMVEGRDTTEPYLFTLDGRDTGYIQLWHLADNRTPETVAESPWLSELPEGTVGVDLSIGDAGDLSKGIGTAALEGFVAELRRRGLERIIIDPDPENGRACRAYEKAGFRPVAHLAGRTGDALIMEHVAGSGEGRA